MRLLLVLSRLLLWIICLRFVRGWYRTRRGPSEAFMVLWLLGALGAVFMVVLAMTGWFFSLPLALALTTLVMPWTITRWLLIPLGLSRPARRLALLSGWAWGTDRRGGGLIAGAWAILRKKQPDRAAILFIEQARDRQRYDGQKSIQTAGKDIGPRFTAATALATGLLAAARGDRETARQLIASVDELGKATTPAMVQKLAREWLVGDAVEQGQWSRVAELAAGPGPRTRMTRLAGAAGARLSYRKGAPGDVVLLALWLIAPCRRHTLALVREAWAVKKDPTAGAARPRLGLETSLIPDPYSDALASHVALLAKRARQGITATDLASLAQVWDRALLSPDTRTRILMRAAALGARNGERALAEMSALVAGDLAELALTARLPLAGWSAGSGPSPLLADARRQLEDELMSELELAFDATRERVIDKRLLAPVDEWREWLSLRTLYERAAAMGGVELRRLAFPHVHHTVCKLAVWLWNDRQQLLIANAMFRWLLSEALVVGDSEAIELQSRNWDQNM